MQHNLNIKKVRHTNMEVTCSNTAPITIFSLVLSFIGNLIL